MLKKYLALALLLCSATSHAECWIEYNSANIDVNNILKEKLLEFQAYDDVCNKLKRANAQLAISGYATTFPNSTVAWASVSLQDSKLPIVTNEGAGQYIATINHPSRERTGELLHQSILKAIDLIYWDLALKSLDASRKAVRAVSKK